MTFLSVGMLLPLALCVPQDNVAPEGYLLLFNGRDLAGWKAGDDARTHWTVRKGILRHDGKGKDLWTERSFGDFNLKVSWRWPDKPVARDYPVFDSDGNEVKGPDGKVKTERMLDAGDSGIFMRGFRKAQANLFCYPCGSGEVWEYRTDPSMPPEVRRAVTPKLRADRPVGEWNEMSITLRGDRLTVVLNGKTVIEKARLPGVPPRGPIGFQKEHGPIEFKNISLKELP